MATFEDVILPAILTMIVTLAALLVARHLKVFDSTAHNSTTATIHIGTVQEDVKKMEKLREDDVKEVKRMHEDQKEHFDVKLDGLTQLIERKDVAGRQEFARLYEQNIALDKKMIRFEIKLEQLEGKVEKMEANTK